jgi:hypothetical protein
VFRWECRLVNRDSDIKGHFDNDEFWNARYREYPALGSGPGSRGYAAWVKQQLVKRAISDYGCRSLIDIGCGDVCWLDEDIISRVSSLGIDVSTAIIELNARNTPGVCLERRTQPFAHLRGSR